jgi:hypothetical protein
MTDCFHDQINDTPTPARPGATICGTPRIPQIMQSTPTDLPDHRPDALLETIAVIRDLLRRNDDPADTFHDFLPPMEAGILRRFVRRSE